MQVLGQRLTVLNIGERQPGSAVEALLRPEALAIVPDAAGAGEVTLSSFLGASVRLEVVLDGGQKVLVESSSQDASVAVGDRVGLRIVAESAAVSDPGAAPAPETLSEEAV